ncbi:MAG TPA: hypothetical protein VFY04_09820 [Solirubrobacterales bacterium]|nr:hypothetical protein [Solirubrobacterales bacterium]
MQAPSGEPVLNRLRAEPEVEQLTPRHHPVLACGEPPYLTELWLLR